MVGKKKIEEVKAFLGKGTEFEGKLLFTGSVRIEGKFKGQVVGGGTLNVGEGARIEGEVFVDNVLIGGEVIGNLEIKKRTEIFSRGNLSGELKTTVLVVHEGALFEGNCQMKAEPALRAVERGRHPEEEVSWQKKESLSSDPGAITG
jgi:cytoskeletal protein CcmA (bactofilin family)